MRYDATIHLPDGETLEGELTTEHATSSYGLPVLVVDSEPQGAGDLPTGTVLEIDAGEGARSIRQRAERAGYTVSPVPAASA